MVSKKYYKIQVKAVCVLTIQLLVPHVGPLMTPCAAPPCPSFSHVTCSKWRHWRF